MEFGLSEEQTILKNEARRFLSHECLIDLVKSLLDDETGYSPTLWKKMAALGWMGILFEERYGGTGGTFFDVAMILEEMGRFLVPGPFLSTVMLGGVAIMKGGNEDLKNRLLRRIASGDLTITCALTEMGGGSAEGRIELRGESRQDGLLLNGRKVFVPNAGNTDLILCSAEFPSRDGAHGFSLLLIDPKTKGILITPLVSLDLQKQFEVIFTDAAVPRDQLIGDGGRGGALLQEMWPIAVAAKCCEMFGGMQRVFEIVLDYAQKRYQFGKPISAFQAIQHYCSEMAIELECSRLIIRQAAWRISENLPSKKEAAMAKAWASDAFKKITKMAHQIYGAIGFTKEQDLYLYYRHAKASEIAFGDSRFHKELVAKEMPLEKR